MYTPPGSKINYENKISIFFSNKVEKEFKEGIWYFQVEYFPE